MERIETSDVPKLTVVITPDNIKYLSENIAPAS